MDVLRWTHSSQLKLLRSSIERVSFTAVQAKVSDYIRFLAQVFFLELFCCGVERNVCVLWCTESAAAAADACFTGPDCTAEFLGPLFISSAAPPSYAALDSELPVLDKPLPMLKTIYDSILYACGYPDHLSRLATPLALPSPARQLAICVSTSCNISQERMNGAGEIVVLQDATSLVIGPMLVAAKYFGVSARWAGDQVDPSGTTKGQLRPDALFFFDNSMMFKAS